MPDPYRSYSDPAWASHLAQGMPPRSTLSPNAPPISPNAPKVPPAVLPRALTIGPMIALVNMATNYADSAVAAMAGALQVQVDRDFGPAWNLGANLIAIPVGHSVPAGAWPIYFLDHSDQADALGYHDQNGQGVPFSRVFIQDDIADGISPSVTVSHELLEMLGDPNINLTVAVFADAQHLTLYAKEMCDAVEDDKFGYLIGDTLVSDFVLPAYFDITAPAGARLSFKDNVHTPFGLAEGGYSSLLQAGPNGLGAWTEKMARVHSPRQDKRAPLSRSLRRWGGAPDCLYEA